MRSGKFLLVVMLVLVLVAGLVPQSMAAGACGNGKCGRNETCSNCPQDCGTCPPVCGDGQCNGNETCTNCSADCGICPPVCGDGQCNGNETCETCSIDCGTCGTLGIN